MREVDVIVVGGGNAGFATAHAARERGRSVALLERGTHDAGGNSYYTAGATRITHDGLEDLLDLVEPDPRHDRTTVPPYSAREYLDDLVKVTDGRTDPELSRALVDEAADGLRWLRSLGLRYRLMYERQAFERPDGSYLFWGGLHVGNVGGGIGLIDDHTRVAKELGATVHYGADVTGFVLDGDRVAGVEYHSDGRTHRLLAESVVIASGGFEANAALREKYLGPGWGNAKVRGTPHNTGRLLIEAIEVLGAARGGDWSTCHSVQWDAWHPDNESNRELTNRLTRGGYPLGVIVNRDGRRFVDEGADFRNYTYARYGRDILEQPGSVAFQIFDSEVARLLRSEEYQMPGVSVRSADTIAGLAGQIGVDPGELSATIGDFNAAIDTGAVFDPNVKDGRRADVTPPKSNWAVPLRTPPFYAYPVTCGITFTFGGLRAGADTRVLRADGQPIPGLFVAGEALGGLFSGNYPGGTGLAAGVVFGRRAGGAA
ncbi:FAD-dependent tricarballylate dehydrogenase TcuA [Mycolicibacterium vaccae]|uniref:FAD-dependent tricarballylate dehydrogenase TcuA n=1 Tax=Mycolicibacterium vaccae TaxID=1810 RepID=UPI003CFDFA81